MPVNPPYTEAPIRARSAQQAGKNLAILIKAISVLKVEEGDVIVLECPTELSRWEYERLGITMKELVENVGFKNVSIAILEGGITIKTIRKVDISKRLTRRMDSEFQSPEKG